MGRPQAGCRGPSLGGQCLATAGAVLGAQHPLRPTPPFSPRTRVSWCVLLRNDPGALTARPHPPQVFQEDTASVPDRQALGSALQAPHASRPAPGAGEATKARPGRGPARTSQRSEAEA